MSVEFTQEELQTTAVFLRDFTSQYPIPTDEILSLPLRVAPTCVRSVELNGCLIEWTFECLRKCQCPDVLAAIITNQVTKDILDNDHSCYKHGDNEELDISKAARDVFHNIQNLCSQWNQKTPRLLKSKRSYHCCVHAIKNTRRKMEDKHVVLPYFNSLFGLDKAYPDLAFFAVYDGHGGTDAAVYSSMHLHCILANNKNLFVDPGLALQETFVTTDETFGVKAKAEGLRSGCTAVTALISDDKMYIGWLGDSQVVLCKAGEAVSLMEPHKPENQEERERIEALGGCVVYFGAWRVNGSLSVSRAIGDVEHKPYISGEPCIAEYTFEGNEEFIVLACDGLWDTVGRVQAIELVISHISQGNSKDTAAKLLVDTAKNAGSSDNISVVIVYLDAHKSNVQTDNFVINDQQDIKTNGIIQTNEVMENNEESYQGGCTRVHVVEKEVVNHDSLVAKVKISNECAKVPTNVTCKVTSEKYDSQSKSETSSGKSSEKTSKSADNSPKQSRTCKTGKSKVSLQFKKGPKGKTSNQLGFVQGASSRRKSAPADFSS